MLKRQKITFIGLIVVELNCKKGYYHEYFCSELYTNKTSNIWQ